MLFCIDQIRNSIASRVMIICLQVAAVYTHNGKTRETLRSERFNVRSKKRKKNIAPALQNW